MPKTITEANKRARNLTSNLRRGNPENIGSDHDSETGTEEHGAVCGDI
jgi:hypothetical protein